MIPQHPPLTNEELHRWLRCINLRTAIQLGMITEEQGLAAVTALFGTDDREERTANR